MGSRFLAKICSCALAQLHKSALVVYFPKCVLVLILKGINCYSRSYLLHLHISLEEWIKLIKFLFNCSIKSFRSTVAPSKVSYACSISLLVFRWRKCCEAQLRLCENPSNWLVKTFLPKISDFAYDFYSFDLKQNFWRELFIIGTIYVMFWSQLIIQNVAKFCLTCVIETMSQKMGET